MGNPALLYTEKNRHDTTASAAPVGVADYPSTPIIFLYSSPVHLLIPNAPKILINFQQHTMGKLEQHVVLKRDS